MHRDLELSQVLLNERIEDQLGEAARQRDQGHGRVISYSRKVFVPLTRLCRNVCHYCAFAKSPGESAGLFLAPEEVLEIAKAGERAGCREALFTLGDKPELRYPSAREQLRRFGYPTRWTTLSVRRGLSCRSRARRAVRPPGRERVRGE